jgi:3-oxocholest-4-en-26-oyl-CoA dehydrogenase beta subunit
MAIDLTFNEEQQLIQNTAREFFAKRCPPDLARKYENSEDEFPREIWREMADLGWLGMNFPAEYDGLECSFLDMYGLYVEMGRTVAPTPHLEAVALGGALVARLGSDAQKRALLPKIAAGEALATLAFLEPDGLYGPEGVTLAATGAGSAYKLSGVKVLVPYVRSAERLVVAARTSGTSAEAGVSLFLVDPNGAGVSVERTANTGGYPLYAVSFDGAAGEPLGPVDAAWDALHEVMMQAAVLQSAMVVGAGERVLDISVGYAKDRVQFGVPIGKHQAVQYLCTDIAIQGQVTRLLALHAAWKIDSGQPFIREAALAKAQASKAAAAMTFAAHEVHAGIGFMKDYDLQLYTLRGKHWEFNLGDQRHHFDLAMRQTTRLA